ncbi:hypothetical protein LCM08_24825 [Salipiger pacificus]|nr:hypothetical protein [Alloyangia pacifica]MCA0948166.1 hypothetical protein [Alloyangia pacifica]
MSPNRLIYLFDPLCGWCYGASLGLERLNATGIAIELLPTGLFSGRGGREMDADFASYAWSNDQRIAQMTGVTFSDVYRRLVLEAGGLFDSSLATLAVTAAGGPGAPERRHALRALQLGRYVEGRSLTSVVSVSDMLMDAGLHEAAALLQDMPDALADRVRAETERAQLLMQGLGARGVPTLARLRNGKVSSLPSALLLDPDADLASALGDRVPG